MKQGEVFGVIHIKGASDGNIQEQGMKKCVSLKYVHMTWMSKPNIVVCQTAKRFSVKRMINLVHFRLLNSRCRNGPQFDIK